MGIRIDGEGDRVQTVPSARGVQPQTRDESTDSRRYCPKIAQRSDGVFYIEMRESVTTLFGFG